MEEETSWTATIALVLSLIAIIFLIVVVYLFSVNSSVITNRIDDWTLKESGTSGTLATPEPFIATPNTILNLAPGISNPYYVQIQPYDGIGSIVTAGRTTIFQIVNTRSASSVVVSLPPGITFAPGSPNPAAIGPNNTATYMWVSPTLVQRID